MTIILIGLLIALAFGGACFRALWKLTQPQGSSEDLSEWIDINWQANSPLERLMDPAEFEFLRKRGLSRQRVAALRARRRLLFRSYIRRLTHEFNVAHSALQAVVVSARVDRPDLVKELGRQRLLFYRALIGIEVRLTVNALGFTGIEVPSFNMLRPLERLHMEFCNLVPDLSAAQA